MNWKSRLLYSQNWNIGFCDQTPEDLISAKKLNKVQWMKHPYKDRWFADPFIYKVTGDEIVVFAEECQIADNPKGILCELHLDRRSKRLKERFVLLELDTHLSYPAIIEHEGKVYVYPENGASGKLNIYEYDEQNHRLVNPRCIIEEALADSTILKKEDKFYLIATKVPHTQECVFLYESDSLFGPYRQIGDLPVQNSRICSRPAGNWLCVQEQLYRPSQMCKERYGAGVSMQKILGLIHYSETTSFEIKPFSYRYHLGCHTINFDSGNKLCVVDSYGYLYPTFARFYSGLSKMKSLIKKQ